MLVCPHCQYENPDNHKFCQKCGTSLTEVICPGCDATVPSNAEKCPHCGTTTGMIWRAIVLTSTKQTARSSKGQEGTVLVASQKPLSNQQTQVSPLKAHYLDAQQRYQLLDPLPDPIPSPNGTEVRVLDCQPYQPTLLATLYKQQTDLLGQSPLEDAAELGSISDSMSNNPFSAADLGSNGFTLPIQAQTYLNLEPDLNTSLPQIHDAWEHNGRIVLLLVDRTDLPLLSDEWGSDDTLPLQILHWLYQITELWEILLPHGCCQSLLELSNLRVDEDQLLCLQRLYVDKPDHSLTLKDLGRLWQLLFQISQRTQLGALARLCHNLETGEIADLQQLRSQFDLIVNEFQSPSPSTGMPLDSKQPINLPFDDDGDRTMELVPGLHINLELQRELPPSTTPEFTTSPPRLELGNLNEDMSSDGDDVPTVVLPMKLLGLEDAGRSDVGRQRDHNEDCFSIETEIKKVEGLTGRTLQAKGVYILCDGMGGHASGEVASAMAVETLKTYFATHWGDQLPNEATIREAVYLANKAIYDLNQQNERSGSGRMGTTLVLVLIQDTHMAIAHVGDSRLYRFSRRRGLEQVTVDHEVGQREIQRGVEPAIAYARPDAYQLTQALGPRDENFVNPDVQFMELNEDLLLLLCSDGLTDNDLLETHCRTHVEPLLSAQTNLEQGVTQLIDLANQCNGHDNITAVVIRTKVRPNLEQLRRG